MSLERRKPMRRDGPGARRFAAKRSRLPPVSSHRAKANRDRRAAMIDRFGPNPPCYAGRVWREATIGLDLARHEARALARHECGGSADDAHEVLTRARAPDIEAAITDPGNVVPACRACHDLIGHLPALADRVGLTSPSPPGC